MVKRAIQIPTFNPKDTLKDIREKSLNPVIERVLTVEGNIETNIVPKIDTAYDDVKFDQATSKLTFEKIGTGASTIIDLKSIVPVFAGINIKGYTNGGATDPGSGEVIGTSKLKFEDGTISEDTGDGYANITYEWNKIVPKYQVDPTVTIEGGTTTEKVYSKLEVAGEGGKKYFTYTGGLLKEGTLKIDMPLIPSQMTAQVVGSSGGDDTKPINSIKVTGTVGGSNINGDVLEIDLQSGGGTFAVGYFKGFYNAIEEIDKTGLVPDRSSAYIKTDIEGATIYTLYMYKGESVGWKAILNSPPLLFNGTPKQAIHSIKENTAISLSSDGILNLDGLMNHIDDAKGYIGIFDSLDKLNAFPAPVQDKSMALVRDDTLGVFKSYTYRLGEDPAGAIGWELTPVQGSLKFVDNNIPTPSYKPLLGVKSSSGVTLDSQGIMTITPPKKGNIQVKAKDSEDHEEQDKTVKGLHFVDGIYVDLTSEKDWAVIKHPQRVVHYNDDFEKKHETSLFMGNIFFDQESSRWIGWSEGKGGGAETKPKWTTIAHRGMSDEVLSLHRRYPEQLLPTKVEEPTKDDFAEASRGYLPQGNVNLPEEIRSKSGGFLQTDVKANTATAGQETNEIRTQIIRPDDGTGGVWQRSYDCHTNKWRPWIKTSFTSEDLKSHEVDPRAHNNVLRYYRTYALFGTLKDIFKQTTGDLGGGLKDGNSILLADNYGYSSTDPHDYLDAPYGGKFNISGALSFNGYGTDKAETPPRATDGRWQVLLRKRNTQTAGQYDSIGLFTYQFKSGSKVKKYPTLSFEVKDVDLEPHQEVVININFWADGTTPASPGELITKHPRLYLTPTRCNITIEDNKTRAGSYLARAFRVLYGNLDALDDVGVRTHHSNPSDPTSGIRVYGEKVQKTATPMIFSK